MTGSEQDGHVVYEFAGYRLDSARREITRGDGEVVILRAKAFDALVYLVEHSGRVVSRAELTSVLWPKTIVEENNLSQTIWALRRALSERAHDERYIATVPGRGYQFVEDVRRTVVPPAVRLAMNVPGPVEAAQSEHTSEGGAPAATTGAVSNPRAEARPRFAAHWRIATAAALALAAAIPLAGSWRATAPFPRLGSVVSVTPVTSYPGEESTPAMAPDATRVAFSWDGGTGNRDIYVTQVGTSTRVRLTTSTEGADRYPAWSPNGEQIAFLRERDASQFDVLVIPALGGTERLLYAGQRNWISRDGFPLLTWTPDSRQLVFTTKRSGTDDAPTYGLHRLSVATGDVEPLDIAGSRENYDTSPAISADGTLLAFARYRRSERLNQVMVQRLGPGFTPRGEPQTVPGLDPGIYHSIFWMPGDRLCFAGGGQIFEWNVGGAPRVVYTEGPHLPMTVIAMASGGAAPRAALVARHDKPDIFALPLNTHTHEAAGPPAARVPSTATEKHPRLSPDGKRLAFVSDRTGRRAVWLAAADGSDPQPITDLEQLITGYPRWSPDGTRIAFHTSASGEARVIWLVDVEKRGPATRLINGCCPGGWSADGQYLYVSALDPAANHGFISRVNVATRSQELLFEGQSAVESSDGRYLLYAKTRERGYFRRSLNGRPAENEEQRLVTDYRPPVGGIAPVADGFFYIGLASNDEPRAVRFFDYALGEPRDIAPVSARTVEGLSVSPDGRELLYAAVGGPSEADIVLLEFAVERGTN